MKNIKSILFPIAFAFISYIASGEVSYGAVSGAEFSDEATSVKSAMGVLGGIGKENKYIWIQPLKTTTESTKSGKRITTIVYKAATASKSKLTIEEQIELGREIEKKYGLAPGTASGMPKSVGVQGLLKVIKK